MAFPVVETTNTSVESSGVLNHTVSLPSGIVSGDKLIVAFAHSKGTGTDTVDWPSGWVEVAHYIRSGGDFPGLSIGYRNADGTEGSTITISTPDVSVASSHTARRISGASTTAPEVSTAVEGDSANPDPGSVTPSWGAADTLWEASAAIAGKDNTASAAPTNYSDLLTTATSGGGPSSTHVGIGTAVRALNASSEDPGSFTFSGSDHWVAFTLAIEPAGAASPQTLEPTLYDDPDTFGAHNVAIEQFLDTALFTDGDTFGSHSIGVSLFTTLFQDPDTFGTHQLNLTLSHSLFSDPDTFGTAQINQSLTTTLFSDPDNFGSHSISAVLTASLFQNVSTFGTHTVSPGTVTLTTTLYTDPDTFGSHTVNLESQVLQPTLFSDSDSFGNQQVNLVLSQSLFSDGDNFGSPQLNLTVLPSLYDDTDVFGSHTVVTETFLTTTLYSDPDSFGTHEVQYVLSPSLFVDTDNFGSHTIQPGAVTLITSLFVNTNSFGSHFIDDTGGGGAGGGAQARKRYRIKLRRNFT